MKNYDPQNELKVDAKNPIIAGKINVASQIYAYFIAEFENVSLENENSIDSAYDAAKKKTVF